MKKLFCIKKGDAMVSAKKLGRKSPYFETRKEAKEARDALMGEELPDKEDPHRDHPKMWKFYVAPGPDHWKNNEQD